MALEALPFVNWLFWATLASGTLAVVAVTELLGGTTRGYGLLMAWTVVLLTAVLVLSELALPGPDAGARRALVILFAAGAIAHLVAAHARLPRAWLALVAAGSGMAAIVVLARTTAGTTAAPASALFAGQLLLAAVVLGSVTAAMLLGHWYLVTPRLSPRPLRRMMWLLLAALIGQAVAFVVAVLAVPGGALEGGIAWLSWLRLLVGILLPIVITVLAILASRAASLQASTGLLYIGLALIIAGSIAGSSITYLTGVPI